MFSSLKGKILALIIFVTALSAAPIIFFTIRDVGTAMIDSEKRSATNILNLVETTIASNYRNLLFTRVRAVMDRKNRLRDAMDVAMSGLRDMHDQATAFGLDEEEAKERALEWIRGLHYGEGEYFFVFNEQGVALAYPEKDMEGRSLSQFTDIKSRSVTEGMWEETGAYGSAFDVFHWKELGSWKQTLRIGFFVRFEHWDWVVATGMDIADIQREENIRKQNLIQVLESSLSGLRIAQSGFVMLFDGDGELYIPSPEDRNTSMSRAALSAPSLLDELKLAQRNDTILVRDQATDRGFETRPMEFSVRYFKALDWYYATAVFTDELQGPARDLVTREVIIIAVVFGLGFFLSLTIASRISRPLLRLADYSRKLAAREDFTRPSDEGGPIRAMARRQGDEVGRLAKALVFMEDELRANVTTLLKTTATRERLENELALAARIQQDMLPRPLPISPSLRSVELSAELKAAKAVGGDLYQFFQPDESRLLFAVGDVADKGMPASLFMAMTTTLIKAEAKGDMEPGLILSRINKNLCQGNRANMFVTLVLCVLHLETGEMRFSSGGHNPLLLARNNGQVGYLPVSEDPMLGLLPEATFKTMRLALKPGDMIAAYSDGVTDAINPERIPFGEERLRRIIGKNRAHTPEMLGKIVLASIKGHCREEPQFDDVALLLLKYKG